MVKEYGIDVDIEENTVDRLSAEGTEFPIIDIPKMREYLNTIDKFKEKLYDIVMKMKADKAKHVNANVTEYEYESSCNDGDGGSWDTYSYYREYYFTSKVVLLKN